MSRLHIHRKADIHDLYTMCCTIYAACQRPPCFLREIDVVLQVTDSNMILSQVPGDRTLIAAVERVDRRHVLHAQFEVIRIAVAGHADRVHELE